MKIFAYFIIALIAISCLKTGENSYYIKSTGRVEITQADIPDSADLNLYTEIKARSEGFNGCWSNLNFVLTKKSDFEYTLEAYGVYESYGTCPDIKVYGDTTIAFKPTLPGKYVFQVLKSQNETVADTMVVSNPI